MSRVPRSVPPTGPFLGSSAVLSGEIAAGQLRGPGVVRLFRDVYQSAEEPRTHVGRCAGAALILPKDAVITGRSAATLAGVPLAGAADPVELVVPLETRIFRREGLRVRRSDTGAAESEPWGSIRIATPPRAALDLLLDRPLGDAVADLDAVLRAGTVCREQLRRLLTGHDRGIVAARRAEALADSRAESRPESRLRVVLRLAGLDPVPQYRIHDADGYFARPDLAFPDRKVAVEYDGAWREGDRWALARDRARLNRLRAAGWRIVFVTAALLHDEEALIREVTAALAAA